MEQKQTPILFGSHMVLAILDKRKVQTRRMIKFPKDFDEKNVYGNGIFGLKYSSNEGEDILHRLACPYGSVGDMLYVRETHYRFGRWIKNGLSKKGKQAWKFLEMNQDVRYIDNPPNKIWTSMNKKYYEKSCWYKRNSLFMPKSAVRILLKITDIGVERIQDITGVDACKEGIESEWFNDINERVGGRLYKNYLNDKTNFEDPIKSFHSLFTSINGEKAWNENKWVWVISFDIISTTGILANQQK